MLDEERKKLIEELTAEVNTQSEKYQLVHACFAIQMLLKEKAEKMFAKERAAIKKRLMEVSPNDMKEIERLKTEQKKIKEAIRAKRLRIQVSYLRDGDVEAARTVRVDNTLHIVLPGKLARHVRTDQGGINYESIATLRKLMAHELGHIMLHLDSIMSDLGTQGTKNLSEDAEEEADFFAERLIERRQVRNLEFYKDRGHERI
jgi:hypothetical protein